MIIKNVKKYTENGNFEDAEIYIEGERFAGSVTEDASEPVIDGEGAYALPGLIDLHFHGCIGADFCDGSREALEKISAYEASVGVTTIAPATMTLPTTELEQILANAAEYQSPAKKGAQDERNIIPCDADICRRFLEASEGLVKFIGIAPEESEDAVSFIKEVKDEVHVSLAHTNADYDTALAAFQAGADHAVHLYNAMPPFTHRAPGVVGAAADCEHVWAELICDSVHIHPATVRATFKMLGDDRIVLISDSMRATGMPDGVYTLGGLDVQVKGNRATLVSDGALAGSVTNLMDCMRTAVKQMDISLESAVKCATINPARCLGIDKDYGSITAGKYADLVLLDQDLNIKQIIKKGALL